jgi:hypothetical protein
MKKLLFIPAYIWAFACFLLIPVTFIKNDTLAEQLARLPFMKIHPKYSGGKENRTYMANGLLITVNEPVYGGIKGRRSNGFVQVKFSGTNKLPAAIHETVDFDFNGQPDFEVSINTGNGVTELARLNPHVKSLEISSKVKNDWVIRVNIDKD